MRAAFERERAARKEAEAANLAKSSFLAILSHEIRTPLNGVLGMADILSETGLGEDQQELVDLITDSGNLLLTIVDDIRDLSRVEEGKLELKPAPISINDLFMSICQQFRPRIEAKGLSFTSVLRGNMASEEVWASIDKARLRQVLGNLLSNALKYTMKGAITFSVAATRDAEGAILLEFWVSDTGTGIQATEHQKLFNPFTQAEVNMKRRHGGMGIGLVLAQQISKEMGGGITVSSLEGDGSEFQVSLKVEAADPPQEPCKDKTEWGRQILSERPWRVLAAEDNMTNQLVLRHLLKEFDLDLTIVADGAALLDLWHAEGADIILMDVNMPVMDGVTATCKIREAEQSAGYKPVPVIAVSANAMPHQVKAYMAHGITDHVSKPTRKPELISAMARALFASREDCGRAASAT